MNYEPPIPETRVLAIASHVVHGYVGNKMASFVMQALGCDVSAINTVNYSNHTAYKQVKGTKTTAEQIEELYEGLKQSNLNDFNVLLTGYVPSAEAVKQVGRIGRDLKLNASTKPGSFFWVLDPVMGDEGKLYIPEDEVPQYKALLREADLILPNQFEAETLTGITITDLDSLATAIQVLHKTYQVPHVIITSLRLTADNHTFPSRAPSRATSTKPPSSPPTPTDSPKLNAETSHPSSWSNKAPDLQNRVAELSHPSSWAPATGTPPPRDSPSPESSTLGEDHPPSNLTIIGSTATSDYKPRLFRIDTPQLPLFFSGTGDLFAALTIPRLIEAVQAASTPDLDLRRQQSWRSPDEVKPEDLPLAKACQKVLASLHAVLTQTERKCATIMKEFDILASKTGAGPIAKEESDEGERKKRHLALMKASEVTVVRYLRELVDPPDVDRFVAKGLGDVGAKVAEEVGDKRGDGDELGVVGTGVGVSGEGGMVLGNGV